MCAVPVRDKSLPVQSRLRHSLYRNFVAQRALRLAQSGCSTPGRAIVRFMNRGSRPRKNRIEVWCDDDELAKIKANAKDTNLSNSEFLRNLGKGYEPKSAFDKEAIRGLAKLHADQDRLGGLLAQCLSESKAGSAPLEHVRPLLQEIESLQTFIAKLVLEQARSL